MASDLLDLQFFAAIARARTLAEAARTLGVTPPAVTKRLAALERRLGVRLVLRSPRAIGLTDEGLRLREGAARLLAELDALEHEVAGARAQPRGLLRVNASFGFARRYLAPAIARLARAHPRLEVQLDLTDRLPSAAEHAFDVAIRLGAQPSDARLVARPIAANRRLLCASPAYLARHGEPRRPADLASHQCLVIRQDAPDFAVWRFARRGRSEAVKVHGALSSNDGEVVKRWAIDGLGLMVRSEWDIADDVRAGRLVRLLSEWGQPGDGVLALVPPALRGSPKVDAFVRTLKDEIGEPPPWRLD